MPAGNRSDGMRAARRRVRRWVDGTDAPPRVVGYMSDFLGGGGLEAQLALVAPFLTPGADDRCCVVADIGWADPDAECPPALFRLVRFARVRALDVIVVERVARFAKDPASAVRIAAMLCDVGVQIREARSFPRATRSEAKGAER